MVDLGGRAEHVSVDRVKAAHLDLGQPVVLARPPRRGRAPALTPVTDLGPTVPVLPLPAAAPAPVLRSRGGLSFLPAARTLCMGEFWGGLVWWNIRGNN